MGFAACVGSTDEGPYETVDILDGEETGTLWLHLDSDYLPEDVSIDPAFLQPFFRGVLSLMFFPVGPSAATPSPQQ